MKLSIEVDIQEMNRIFEGLCERRVRLIAGTEGKGNPVASRSTADYIALMQRSLASLESVNEKLQDACNDAQLWGPGAYITTARGS